MKTINRSKSMMKAVLTLAMAVVFTAMVNGQFETPTPDSPITQNPTEEVRTGSTITYDLTASHSANDEYRWEISGGTITSVNGGGTIVGGTVVEFTVDANTITIDWDQAPAGDIASLSAQIQVQKKSADGCYSQVNTLPINVWNAASATITTAAEDICSGEAPGVAVVTVALTGAPDGSTDGFAVDYSFSVPVGLSALDGGGLDVATSGTVTTDGATVNIPMPASFVNSGSTDLDFVVSLTRMNDDFTGDGAYSGTYTVTVHPVPETGNIVSSSSLTRR